ncbi:MAG: hypothetical protein GQ582_01255, partial [Methyloprofundus sp.]|nr:hypothetical protein [Methyloprofundus sp.]
MRDFKSIQDILGKIPDIKKAYLIGCTGAGKTSLVQHIIGSKKHEFPITAHSRTTTTPTEYVFQKDKPFKTTIILKKLEDISCSIEELIQNAILKAKENEGSIEDIVYELEQLPDEHFKLHLMVSSATFKEIAETIKNIVLPLIAKKTINDETLFSPPSIQTEIQQIVVHILDEIENNFNQACGNEHQLFTKDTIVIEGIRDKDAFILENKRLLSHEFGSIAILADYIRIEGNLLADWLDNDLEFMLIDGEGIGHSYADKRDTLSARHYDFFNFCNNIILLEDAGKPFTTGGQGAIEWIYLNGYQNKFNLVFSKADMLAQSDQSAYFRRNINNLKSALKKDNIDFKIENKDSYKLKGLNHQEISDSSKDAIQKLLLSISQAQESALIPLEYDFNLLLSNFNSDAAIDAIQD